MASNPTRRWMVGVGSMAKCHLPRWEGMDITCVWGPHSRTTTIHGHEWVTSLQGLHILSFPCGRVILMQVYIEREHCLMLCCQMFFLFTSDCALNGGGWVRNSSRVQWLSFLFIYIYFMCLHMNPWRIYINIDLCSSWRIRGWIFPAQVQPYDIWMQNSVRWS